MQHNYLVQTSQYVCNAGFYPSIPNTFFQDCHLEGDSQVMTKRTSTIVPHQVFYKSVEYTLDYHGTKKGQSIVCKYIVTKNDNNIQCPPALAVKIVPNDSDDAKIMDVITQQWETGWLCPYGIIKYINPNPYHYSLQQNLMFICMEWMDGSLSDLERKVTKDQAIQIVFEVLKAVYVFYYNKIKLVYNDLKCANVLYKCIGPNQYRILLGDFGSLYKENEEDVQTTYISLFSYEYNAARGPISSAFTALELNVVWGLCMIYIELLCDTETIHKFLRNWFAPLVIDFNKTKFPLDQRTFFIVHGLIQDASLRDFLQNLMNCDTIHKAMIYMHNLMYPQYRISSKRVSDWWLQQ